MCVSTCRRRWAVALLFTRFRYRYLNDFAHFLRQAAQHDQILKLPVNWEAYQAGNLLTADDLSLLRRYDKKAPETQKTVFEKV